VLEDLEFAFLIAAFLSLNKSSIELRGIIEGWAKTQYLKFHQGCPPGEGG